MIFFNNLFILEKHIYSFLLNLQKKKTQTLHIFNGDYFILWGAPKLILSDLSTAFSNKNHQQPHVASTEPIQMDRKWLYRSFHSHETQKFIIATSPPLQLSTEKQQEVEFSLICYSVPSRDGWKSWWDNTNWKTSRLEIIPSFIHYRKRIYSLPRKIRSSRSLEIGKKKKTTKKLLPAERESLKGNFRISSSRLSRVLPTKKIYLLSE